MPQDEHRGSAMSGGINMGAMRRANDMTQIDFSAAREFNFPSLHQWECGASWPSGPARTLGVSLTLEPLGVASAAA